MRVLLPQYLCPCIRSGWLILLVACKAPEQLPEDLDGLMHYSWANWEDGAAADLAGAVSLLDAAVGGGTLDGVLEGSLTDLSSEEAALVGVDRDPAKAQGLFIARDFECDIARLAQLLVALEQDELYPGNYDLYDRSYTSDFEDWESGAADRLTWEVDYETSLLGSAYSASVHGGLRRIKGLDPELTACDTALLGRFVLPEPAVFEDGSSKALDLNFQLELFYEREPGRIVHLYGNWQYADMGAGVTTDGAGAQSIILNNMASWDDQTEILCAE
jgi:hypothetical protein